MDKIAVIIPCYNEEQTIRKVIEDYRHILPEAAIYVFDNASTDNTAILSHQAGAVVKTVEEKGKGNVIREAFKTINAECYLIVDGDDTYPPSIARMMCDYVLHNGYHMVSADRLSTTYFSENKRLFHNVGNIMVRTLVNLLYHGHVKDVMTGYRAISYQFAKSFVPMHNGFEIETEMTIYCLKNNLYIFELPAIYRDRAPGSKSKLNTLIDGCKILKTIISMYSTKN